MGKMKIRRGDTTNIAVNITANGTAIDLTGSTVFFTVRSDYADSSSESDDSDALISQDTTSHTDAPNGSTVIELSPTQTNIEDGEYVYDIQVKASDGTVTTYDIGDFIVLPHVTVRTS